MLPDKLSESLFIPLLLLLLPRLPGGKHHQISLFFAVIAASSPPPSSSFSLTARTHRPIVVHGTTSHQILRGGGIGIHGISPLPLSLLVLLLHTEWGKFSESFLHWKKKEEEEKEQLARWSNHVGKSGAGGGGAAVLSSNFSPLHISR